MVSHRPKPEGWHPEADVPFFDDVAAAVGEARRRAGEGVVAVCAGDVGGQALALGLVDVVAMDVVPVVFGRGKRYFGDLDGQHLLEDPEVVIRGDRVLHLRYPVRRQAPAPCRCNQARKKEVLMFALVIITLALAGSYVGLGWSLRHLS